MPRTLRIPAHRPGVPAVPTATRRYAAEAAWRDALACPAFHTPTERAAILAELDAARAADDAWRAQQAAARLVVALDWQRKAAERFRYVLSWLADPHPTPDANAMVMMRQEQTRRAYAMARAAFGIVDEPHA